MLTAHQRIAWARRWPGYTLTVEEAPRWIFSVVAPEGDECGGVKIVGLWLPHRVDRSEGLVVHAALEVAEMLNSA